MSEALSDWVALFVDGTAEEATTELHSGDRRVRVRARRLGSLGTRRGVVVAMDDVTDELRTERVLAWGEMARQVAHEVKNPLTPIKLSIQHIRRAWNDGRSDFDEILIKNADAMLSEIDRLAAIASSFSRFGAPGGAGETPLSPVSGRVCRRRCHDPIRWRAIGVTVLAACRSELARCAMPPRRNSKRC